ncbi:PilW family protein [Vitiosangium sp. GDMCC 1.1324]|uniref:PilW family protein n=1 Tax=Vitiosangium sp. (strain GDMCC 1.1324) TaxID=2138576 RepID=UPI000D36E5F4|nr:PilW family protein [Vitiosangium sp. GDMCC 1.1324]PTL77652.1 prepilin-type cleavage/methylation domain-containing protein [Vitiosangium sp. GDMCC 1.1324]
MPPSKSPRTHAPHGFTLVELLVGTAVTSIILFAVAFTVLAVQGSYQTESRIKVAVEGARTATSFIERRLRMAGYGVDPRFAFDFNVSQLPTGTKSNYALNFGTGVPKSVTDDLAFRYRDPSWLRRGTYDTAQGLVLTGGDAFGVDFPEGRRFIIACMGGRDYLVMKARSGGVKKDEKKTSNLDVDASLSSVAADAGCLTQTGGSAPYVMMLHELRIRIMDLGGRPFLMAFPGIDTLDLSTAVPLAADVESFQVAYVMNRPSPSSPFAALPAIDGGSSPANWVLGDVGSVSTERTPDPTVTPAPMYGMDYEDAARYNRHPGNIRAVRVSITVRSTRAEPSGRRAFARENLEDSAEKAAADGFYRTNMTTTVRVPNMMSRSAFIPEVGTDPTDIVSGG